MIIIFILRIIEQSRITFEKWTKEITRANREIFGFVSSENSYSALQQRHRYLRIGYRSTWNSCPIYTCEIFRLTPPKATSLTIFFLRRSAYPLYSILRPIWTGECKYPSLSYRFYDFYDRFHYTVEVRSHKCGNSGISTGAHCEARVNGLKTVRTVDYCRAHYGALTSSTDK